MNRLAEHRVLVVGAGLAGLAAARAMTGRGIECEVVELRAAWGVEGTGLFTCANGVHALDRLGLGRVVRQRGVEIHERRIETRSGRLLASISESEIWGDGCCSLGITRAALHEVLAGGADDVAIRFGCSVTALESGPGGVDVTFTDGRRARYGLVVGADGRHSVVRRLTLGPVRSRRVAERVVRFMGTRPPGIDAWTLRAQRAGTFLMVPVSSDQLYCYVSRHDRVANLDLAAWIAPFRRCAPPIPELVDQWTPGASFVDSIDELEEPSVWGAGRVVLIGDAAHAMAPFMAQGSSLAIEDALSLSDLSTTSTAWPDAAERLTAERAARTAWVRARSRRREKLASLPVPVAKLAMRFGGARSWVADLVPLAPQPDGAHRRASPNVP